MIAGLLVRGWPKDFLAAKEVEGILDDEVLNMDWFVQRAADHKDELEYEEQVCHAWCMRIITGAAGMHRCGDFFGSKPLPISRRF